MGNVTVIGAQWGDEGKGKIVDWLSNQADLLSVVIEEPAVIKHNATSILQSSHQYPAPFDQSERARKRKATEKAATAYKGQLTAGIVAERSRTGAPHMPSWSQEGPRVVPAESPGPRT